MKQELLNELQKYYEFLKPEKQKQKQKIEILFEDFKNARPLEIDAKLKTMALAQKEYKILKKYLKALKNVIDFNQEK